MDIQLKYGREKVCIRLPDSARVRVVEPVRLDPPAAEGLIRKALEHPIDSLRLEEIARGKERVVLIVSDKTRATATAEFLPFLLESLASADVPDRNVTIILATGSHTGHLPEEVDQILGPGIQSRFRVIDHDGENADAHVQVGTTSRGTPLLFQREVVESDCLVLTGVVGFHYFAGFGGGRKSILPGVAQKETILANHKLMLVEGNLDEPICPACANGVLEGNPIHEDMMEGARVLNPAFLLNTILSPDGRIADVVAGDPWRAYESGVEKVRAFFGVSAEQKAKLVVASCGGHPKDINFIQVHKSLHHAFELVAEDGVLLLLGECAQGIGSKDFSAWFSTLDLRSVARRLPREFTINAHTAYVTMRKALSRRILMLTALPADKVAAMGMTRVESAAEGIGLAAEALGAIDDVMVLPLASVTVPQPKSCSGGT